MRWFQVDSDTPNDPKIKALLRRGVTADIGRGRAGALLLLWCYVANHGSAIEPGLGTKADGRHLPLDEMAEECLFESEAPLVEFLDLCASRGLVHADLWRDQRLVLLPAMWTRLVEASRQRQRQISRFNSPQELADSLLAGTVPVRPEAQPVTDALRARVYQRDRLHCRYCAVDLAGLPNQRCLDHVVPWCVGGPTTDANLVTACKRCNAKKGGRTPEQAGMTLLPAACEPPAGGGSTGGEPGADGGLTGGQPSRTHNSTRTQQNKQNRKDSSPGGDPPGQAVDLLAEAGTNQVDALVALWNRVRPSPKVREVTPQRRAAFDRALKAFPNLADWERVIVWANGQRWCNAAGTGDHANWRLDLDWLAAGKMAKMLDRAAAAVPEGTRDARRGTTGTVPGQFMAAVNGGGDDESEEPAIH